MEGISAVALDGDIAIIFVFIIAFDILFRLKHGYRSSTSDSGDCANGITVVICRAVHAVEGAAVNVDSRYSMAVQIQVDVFVHGDAFRNIGGQLDVACAIIRIHRGLKGRIGLTIVRTANNFRHGGAGDGDGAARIDVNR